MEIQQRDNETLAAYVIHFKMEAKRCDFNSGTDAIGISVNSGATVSLMHTSVYNMIENYYKTNILPTAICLSTADGSPMASM